MLWGADPTCQCMRCSELGLGRGDGCRLVLRKNLLLEIPQERRRERSPGPENSRADQTLADKHGRSLRAGAAPGEELPATPRKPDRVKAKPEHFKDDNFLEETTHTHRRSRVHAGDGTAEQSKGQLTACCQGQCHRHTGG